MRIFQNAGIYPAYIPRLRALTKHCTSFDSLVTAFLSDRYGAAHFLAPVLERDEAAFFTNSDDPVLQARWAREQGMPESTAPEGILLAQIEHHRTDVFYNMDPMRWGSAFVRKLPGCVRQSIAWRAAPSPGADFAAYDRIVCNFPGILQGYRDRGWRAAWFAPAHDPEMDAYAANRERPIDVLFVGGYSRHHRRRAQVLEAVAGLRSSRKVVFHLDRSRLTRMAESPLGHLLPMGAHRRPVDIRAVSAEPVFGRDLYAAISRSKVVLNGAVDMAGDDRGNMRCFEAMGCGALMVSDQGNYPQGMSDGQSMLTYAGPADAADTVSKVLDEPKRLEQLSTNGLQAMRTHYSKHTQWLDFQSIAGGS